MDMVLREGLRMCVAGGERERVVSTFTLVFYEKVHLYVCEEMAGSGVL